MATHSSVLAWRIPRMGEPGGLPSMGSHRVGHDWSDLAVAAAEALELGLPLSTKMSSWPLTSSLQSRPWLTPLSTRVHYSSERHSLSCLSWTCLNTPVLSIVIKSSPFLETPKSRFVWSDTALIKDYIKFLTTVNISLEGSLSAKWRPVGQGARKNEKK